MPRVELSLGQEGILFCKPLIAPRIEESLLVHEEEEVVFSLVPNKHLQHIKHPQQTSAISGQKVM